MDDVSWSSGRTLLYPPIERFSQWYEKMSAVEMELIRTAARCTGVQCLRQGEGPGVLPSSQGTVLP